MAERQKIIILFFLYSLIHLVFIFLVFGYLQKLYCQLGDSIWGVLLEQAVLANSC